MWKEVDCLEPVTEQDKEDIPAEGWSNKRCQAKESEDGGHGMLKSHQGKEGYQGLNFGW